ncbi:DUF3854 domain-containing protein [Lysinibacillus xylanilyticus]|uniref:DUF3854 domain-containing protein n=1 Tax=Lysinibacillus xylanilyticus TaxID=582475 RepID=UPI0037F10F88
MGVIDKSSLRLAFRDKRSGKGWFEFYRQPCVVCGHTGNCMIFEDEKTVVCTRQASDTIFSKSNVSYVHRLDGEVKLTGKTNAHTTRDKFDDHILSHFFNELMKDSTTKIKPEHIEHFADKRGITEDTIAIRGYCSYPDKPWETAKNVLGAFGNHESFLKGSQGIPGFYQDKYNKWTMVRHNGILIPYRDRYNQVIGFQIRNDNPPNIVAVDALNYKGLNAKVKQPNLVQVFDDGEIIAELEMTIGEKLEFKSGNKKGYIQLKKGQRYVWFSSANKQSGAGAGGMNNPLPVHVSVPTPELQQNNALVNEFKDSDQYGVAIKSKAVWISEGALKADLAIDHIVKAFANEIEEVGKVMLAVPGVNTWRRILPLLEEMGVERINVAFDMDAAQNEDVQKHFVEMVQYLREKYEVYIALWPLEQAKGIDDCLSLAIKPTLRKVQN